MIKSKKIISIVAAATLAFSALALTGCGDKEYKGEAMDGYVSEAPVSSNGGFVVEKGDYVYFINGKEDSTANNTYGKAVKGALMRISKSALAAGADAEEQAKIVVPSVFVSGNYDSGIYIYGDYVYYATPTNDKDNDGNIANNSLDFKRAKLDGKEAPMGGKDNYFFRLSSNTTKYRFVEENGVVYCLYEENSQLKSYNVETGKTTVLVKGASSFFYDKQDLTSPVVYYTMSVSTDMDKTTPIAAQYNQVYSVTAAATATVDAKEASYEVKNGEGEVVAKYDFDAAFLKDNAKDKGYDLGDYTTYPYVNLGTLVLDGIGSMHTFPSHVVMTDEEKAEKNEAVEKLGYTYTLQQQTNGGLYFTRTLVNAAPDEKAKLCYIPNERTNWNAITGNKAENTDIVATDTDSASSSAYFEISATGEHSYIYLADNILKRATTNQDGVATSTVSLAHGVSAATFLKTDGDYLYYYGDGTNGKNMTRINYKGAQSDYGYLGNEDVYAPVTLPLVDWSDSWYKPEFVQAEGKTILLFPNAQSFGSASTAHNYIYATVVGDNAAIKTAQEKIDAVNEYIDGYSANTALQALMKCYFRTKGAATYDSSEGVKDAYNTYQKSEFAKFQEKFKEGGEFAGAFESDFLYQVGRVNEKDGDAIEEAWANSLLKENVEPEDGLATWVIVLIVCGVAIAVAAAVIIPVVIVLAKKKQKKAADEAIVGAYKRKRLDTTDDLSINVYEDEPEEETATPVEEVPATQEPEAVSESAEAPVEEGAESAEEAPSTDGTNE